MECNKDEAIRSKQIAEQKFVQHDLPGAKKFALKARQLFPDLEGLPQLMAVLDVHLVAHDKIHGLDSNWYGVLQVDPSADEPTIRKQYRKLALLLHPDKNKAVGADAAFKIISEAWGVLSDKTKKALHDMRRKAGYPQSSRIAQHKGGSSSNSHPNPNKFTRPSPPPAPPTKPPPKPAPPQHQPSPKAPQAYSQTQTQAQAQAHSQRHTQPRRPVQPEVEASSNSTFWTECPRCKMRYEYLCIYENKILACITCSNHFVAIKVDVTGVTDSWPPPFEQAFSMKSKVAEGFSNVTQFPNGDVSSGTASGQVRQETNDKRAQEEAIKKKGTEEQQIKRESRAKEFEKAAESDELQCNSEPAVDLQKPGVKVESQISDADKKDDKRGERKFEEKSVQRNTTEEPDTLGDAELELSPRRSLRCKRNATNTSTYDEGGTINTSPFKKLRTDEMIPSSPEPLNDDAGKVDNIKNVQVHADLFTAGDSERSPKCEVKLVGSDNNGTLKVDVSQVMRNRSLAAGLNSMAKDSTEQPKADLNGSKTRIDCSKVPAAMDMNTTASDPKSKIDINQSLEDCSMQDNGLASKFVNDSARQLDAHDFNTSKTEVPVVMDPETMNVPDPDFYDFDKDRTESHFDVGQIWAVYDDDDGMPRYYARISKVLSLQPFKVQMSWLEPRFPSDETLALLKSGLSYSCGEFKLGKVTTSKYVNTFSHLMTFEKGQRGALKIYPRKGDVWAIYKVWNVAIEGGHGKHDYEMVEVLADYREDVGVDIAFLRKLLGFKTLFQRDGDGQAFISSNELLRFSHQVPAHRSTSEEISGLPEGCWELDPASTPLELI